MVFDLAEQNPNWMGSDQLQLQRGFPRLHIFSEAFSAAVSVAVSRAPACTCGETRWKELQLRLQRGFPRLYIFSTAVSGMLSGAL